MKALLAIATAALVACWTSAPPIVANPIEQRLQERARRKPREVCKSLEKHAGQLPRMPDYAAICAGRPDLSEEYWCKYVEAAWHATMLRWWADRAIAECSAPELDGAP